MENKKCPLYIVDIIKGRDVLFTRLEKDFQCYIMMSLTQKPQFFSYVFLETNERRVEEIQIYSVAWR